MISLGTVQPQLRCSGRESCNDKYFKMLLNIFYSRAKQPVPT